MSKTNESPRKKMALKTVYGRKCLTKCHPAGEIYLHPVFLVPISTSNDSCAVEPIYITNPNNKETIMINAEACKVEDNKIFKIPDEIETLLLVFSFNPRDFLENIYGLRSFDQVIYWTIQNDHLPFYTIKRIHNCAWKVFGDDFGKLSSNVLEYYFNISKIYWLRGYTKTIQDNYSFELITRKIEPEMSSSFDEMYDFLSTTYYTYDFFLDTIKRYISQFREEWDRVKFHYDNLKEFIFNQLISNIEKKMVSK
jgi:hypothetical protein